MPADNSAVTVSDELRKKFPELVELILSSESMNNEERQYWLNILPIMTPDQTKNLESILTNEKKQLAEIDRKYASEIAAIGEQEVERKAHEKHMEEKHAREEAEEADAKAEQSLEDELLKQIEEA